PTAVRSGGETRSGAHCRTIRVSSNASFRFSTVADECPEASAPEITTHSTLHPSGSGAPTTLGRLSLMEKTKTPGQASRNGEVPFGEATITHRLLDQTHRRIMRTVRQPAGFTFLLIYGPTGVGKTRMIASLHREILAMVSPAPVSACRVLTI